MTAPNGNAQRDVLRQALEAAHLTAPDVDYVEVDQQLRTALGDLIELEALAAVYGKGRTTALEIGAAKTDIGRFPRQRPGWWAFSRSSLRFDTKRSRPACMPRN